MSRRRLSIEDINEMVQYGIASGAFNYPRDGVFPVPSTEWRYPPEMRNEEVKPVSTATEPRLVLEAGSSRVGTMQSHRTFFVYVAPTGMELPIGQCPVIKKEGSRGVGRFGSIDFMTTTTYLLRGEGRLKMVCLSSSFGKPKKHLHLYIDIGPDREVITFKGLGGCGEFCGRGSIDLPASGLVLNREAQELDMGFLREQLEFKILQSGSSSGAKKKGVRSIMYE